VTDTADVVVIDRGVQGASLAFHLAGPAPAVGLALSELILDGAARTVDIAPFAFDRFAAGRLLDGEHGGAPVWR